MLDFWNSIAGDSNSLDFHFMGVEFPITRSGCSIVPPQLGFRGPTFFTVFPWWPENSILSHWLSVLSPDYKSMVTMEAHRFSMEFLSLPRNTMDVRQNVHGIPWNSMDSPWNSFQFHGTSWLHVKVFHGLPWNSINFPCNSCQNHGIPWINHGNSMGFFYKGWVLLISDYYKTIAWALTHWLVLFG